MRLFVRLFKGLFVNHNCTHAGVKIVFLVLNLANSYLILYVLEVVTHSTYIVTYYIKWDNAFWTYSDKVVRIVLYKV